MKQFVVFLAIILFLPENSYGGGYYTSSCSYVKEVIREVPVATFYPLPVYPAYAIGYAPPLAPIMPPAPVVAPVTDCKAITARLEQELAILRQQVAALTGDQPNDPNPRPIPQPPVPFPFKATAEPPLADNLKGLSVMQAKCIQCHEAKVSAAKGKNLVLFMDKTPTIWDGMLQKKILTNVHLGRMPKGGTLTDEEVGLIVQYLDQLPVK